MANIQSAIKRMRQTKKRTARNRMARSEMRTAVRKVESAIAAGDAETAQKALPKAISQVAKKGQDHIIHWRNAARKTSRLTKRVNKAAAARTAA